MSVFQKILQNENFMPIFYSLFQKNICKIQKTIAFGALLPSICIIFTHLVLNSEE